MSHVEPLRIDIDKVCEGGPFRCSPAVKKCFWACIAVGIASLALGTIVFPGSIVWGAYYSALIFWMGIAFGGVMVAVIFQVVHAKWSPPVRRLAEAHVAFLPWALLFLAVTWLGRKELFFWGHSPM
ncbi:MAG: hypothetical protein D6808_05165, partial [Candidatus Dadabacteria bacterium]